MPTNARVNVQKDNVTDALSSSVVVPTGEALTIASGGSLTAEAGSIVNIPASGITGLGTMATQNANAVAITGGSITGITDLAVADGGTGTSSLTGYVKGAGTTPLTASSTIPNTDITGLGTMSTQNASSVAITGGSITGITDLAVADGGTGASNAADARVNLGVSTTGTSILYGDGAGSFSNVTIGSGVSFTSGTLSATGTGGTVTTVSVTPANGVSGTVANPTTTPAISLSLGDITPTTVNSVTLSGSATPNLAVTGTSTISGTNTGDQTISITGDVTAAGSQNTLISTVTKINGQALATLATGILKNTTTTGVPSIAVAADFPTLNQNTTGNAATATNVAVTGVTGLGTGVASFLQTPTSANLSSMVTDETGTGDLVFANSPVLITPHLDTPSVLTLTNATGLPLSTGVTGTLPVANGGTGVTTSTGTGSVVLSASPTLTGIPAAPTAAVGTNTTQIATTQYVQANRGDKYLTTSTSTNTIDNGANKTFNCATDLSYIPTQAVTIVYDINNHMHATVITYNILTGVMVVDADAHTGSGTYSAWTINLGGLTSAGGALLSANNLSDVASAATSRANLGVTATGQDTTYLYRANNLSDLSSVTTARTNLGLGTMATQNSSSVSISGGTVDNVTLVTPTISSIINTGTLTLPNQTDTLVGRATTDVLTNKTLTSPVMTTPSLGVASATSINKVAITAPATGATLTIADGATLTASATATVSGTNTGDQTISITGDVTASGSTGVLTSTVTKVNGTSLAGLATGILKNTTGTGVPSIAVSGSDYAPATSGNSILYGNSAGGFSNVTIGSGVDFTGGTLSATGTGGTVTTVSVTTANGVSGTVANPTTTPAISLTLGAITPTSVSSGSGAFTTLSASGAIRIVTNNVYYAGTTTAGANQNLIGIGVDDNTAVVSKSGNTIKMDAGGSTVGTFSSTGLSITGTLSATGDVTLTATSNLIANKSVLLSDGTTGTATGAIYFINDTDTGFYRAGGNTLGFMGNGASLGTWSPTGLAVTGALSASGNLNFTGTGNRITGDFSNATFANRVAFQSSTTNGNTGIFILPNGTAGSAAIRCSNNSDPTNAAFVGFDSTPTEARVTSGITGTGTYLPMTFYTGGSERMRIDGSGSVAIGTTPFSDTRFTVVPSGDYAPAITVRSNSSAANWARLDLYNANTAGPLIFGQDNTGLSFIRNDGTNSGISFQTSGGVERAKVLTTGFAVTGQLAVTNSASDTVAAFSRTGGNNCYITLTGGSSSDYTLELAAERTGSGSGNCYFGGNHNTSFKWRQGGYAQLMSLDSTNGLAISSKLAVTNTTTSTSSYTNNSLAFIAGPAASSATYIGYDISAGHSGASGANLSGSLIGLRVTVKENWGGTTNAYAIQSQLTNTLNYQVITNGYNFTANSPSLVANSSLTNAYGLYIAQQKVTGVTTGYGIYQENSADVNYFNGNVGIGTSSPQAKLQVNTGADGAQVIVRGAQTGNNQFLLFRNGYHTENTTAGLASVGWQDTGGAGGNLFLATTANASGVNGTPTIRLFVSQNGNVGIGTTSPSSSKLVIESDGTTFGTYGSTINLTAASGTRYHILFRENGTERGSITSNGTTVAYNSVSDYRLKNITGPLTDSGTFIDALKPKVGTWKANGSKFVGFIAHEFAEVSPLSVAGEKDAVDADGKPVYQAMQASSAEVIANLVAELQSLRQRVAALESN